MSLSFLLIAIAIGTLLVALADVYIDISRRAIFLAADLFSLTDVRRVAREIRQRAPSLELLVNNAGGTFGPKELTGDGLERTFALNVAAPFVLSGGAGSGGEKLLIDDVYFTAD